MIRMQVRRPPGQLVEHRRLEPGGVTFDGSRVFQFLLSRSHVGKFDSHERHSFSPTILRWKPGGLVWPWKQHWPVDYPRRVRPSCFSTWLVWVILGADALFVGGYLRYRDIPPFVFYILLSVVGLAVL